MFFKIISIIYVFFNLSMANAQKLEMSGLISYKNGLSWYVYECSSEPQNLGWAIMSGGDQISEMVSEIALTDKFGSFMQSIDSRMLIKDSRSSAKLPVILAISTMGYYKITTREKNSTSIESAFFIVKEPNYSIFVNDNAFNPDLTLANPIKVKVGSTPELAIETWKPEMPDNIVVTRENNQHLQTSETVTEKNALGRPSLKLPGWEAPGIYTVNINLWWGPECFSKKKIIFEVTL